MTKMTVGRFSLVTLILLSGNYPWSILAMQYIPGDVHLAEKSYWYECKDEYYERVCYFIQCITDYDQTTDGPMKCMTPDELYKFHEQQGTLEKLKTRNCYDIRKIYPEEYKNAPKSACIDSSQVSPSKQAHQKSICNLHNVEKVTHFYDHGYYECQNNEDFILQGCRFADGQCGPLAQVQRVVDEEDILQNIVRRVKEEKLNGLTPRTECYEFREQWFFDGIKEECSFFRLVGDLKSAIVEIENGQGSNETDVPVIVPPIIETSTEPRILEVPDDPNNPDDPYYEVPAD